MKATLAAVLLLTACSSSPKEPLIAKKPLGAEGHLIEARRCEEDAAEHQSLIRHEDPMNPGSGCRDQSLGDVSTTGNEPLHMTRPCWSMIMEDNERHRRAANKLLEEAAEHRRMASQLLQTEKEQCEGLGANELAASPFYHAVDIVKVEELKDGERLLGARVQFRRVTGLSADYLRRAIACHQARVSTLGYPDQYQPYDPIALPRVTASVEESADGFWVELRSDDALTASAVLGRANDCAR